MIIVIYVLFLIGEISVEGFVVLASLTGIKSAIKMWHMNEDDEI